jgi:predicted ribosome-associated RNA-binding protein Tma20
MNKKEILINKNNTQYSISLPSKALKSFKIEGKKTYNKFNMLNDKEAIKIKEKKTFLHAKQEPFIFKKNESPVKSLRYINNDTGKIRHYTPGAQE